uniref:Uncharacterized protein n=1 Tax=Arundo donax TaxID=35708 RepID=A0A0A9BU54_ARUDO
MTWHDRSLTTNLVWNKLWRWFCFAFSTCALRTRCTTILKNLFDSSAPILSTLSSSSLSIS